MAYKHLIVDVGNTLMKCALFDGDVLFKEFVCDAELQPLLDSVSGIDISGGMWSAVRKLPASLEQWFACKGVVKFTWQTPVPLKNLYSTPETLGMDRLAAAVGAWSICPKNNILVIDMGTAITFDFVSAEGEYVGGNIAPGKELRYRALAEHTGALPLVHGVVDDFCWGNSTETAIRSGVINGIRSEIDGYINKIKQKFPSLLVFLTGGDANIFDIREKSGIFAVKNLVITGLDCIYKYNEVKK